MADSCSDGYITEADPDVSTNQGYTACLSKHTTSKYRSIKLLTNSKLIHLLKRLLAENTPKTYNEALKIALLLLRSIPPKGYLAEDLFLFFIHLLQSNGCSSTLFLKFLSIAGSTTPYLIPMILLHNARLLAADGQMYQMKYQIQRYCNEWHIEKHHVARYYKWIVRNSEAICNETERYSSDYRAELEHVLMTYADLKIAPNPALFELLIESHRAYPEKVKKMLDLFISLFPHAHFIRKYRAQHCNQGPEADDIIRTVQDSSYASSVILFAVKNRDALSLRQFLLLLFEITISQPNNTANWENLLYHLLTEAPLEVITATVEDLFDTDLNRARSIFTSQGTLAVSLMENCIKYYLATAKIIWYNDAAAYADLYQHVKSATGITLERRYMEGSNPIWQHFKQLPNNV